MRLRNGRWKITSPREIEKIKYIAVLDKDSNELTRMKVSQPVVPESATAATLTIDIDLTNAHAVE